MPSTAPWKRFQYQPAKKSTTEHRSYKVCDKFGLLTKITHPNELLLREAYSITPILELSPIPSIKLRDHDRQNRTKGKTGQQKTTLKIGFSGVHLWKELKIGVDGKCLVLI